MSITKYRAFIKVVELGNITKAARDLQYSQPAISRMIDTLEDEVGFKLLKRTKESITPTENGKIVLEYCRQIVALEDELQAAVNAINGVVAGDIKVGSFNCMLMGFLPQVVLEFTSIYPNINVHMREISFRGGLDALREGNIDIALMNSEIPAGFDFQPLFKDPLGVAVSIHSPLARQESVSVEQLAEYYIIFPQPGWDAMLRQILRSKPFTPKVRHYVASDNAGIAMAANTSEVFILSLMQAVNLPASVTFRPFAESFYRTLGLCAQSFSDASPALKELVKIAQRTAARDEWAAFKL